MAGTKGLHDASSDWAQIEIWCQLHPDANIAIRCGEVSNVMVVVIDERV
jgi:hypothetical protein